MTVAAVILAAGSSSRMGQPKQALSYAGTTLLRWAIKSALFADCFPVYVVVGAESDLISKQTLDLPISLLYNPIWQQGMGSSIRCGVEAVLAAEDPPDALVLLLSDQPLVGQREIRKLIIAGGESTREIVAAEYAGTLGVPALFKSSMFRTLLALEPSKGARNIIRDPRYSAFAIPMPEAELDIDTPGDYHRALQDEPGD